MKNFTLISLIVIVYCFFMEASAQDTSLKKDSLHQYNYTILSKNFQAHIIKDTAKAKIYASTFLKKGKKEKDIYKQADGYYMLAKVSENSDALIYADSIITITKENDNFLYPAEAHLLKSRVHGSQSDYQKSMDELLLADFYAKKNENIDQKFKTKYLIALLKNNLGEYEESLTMLKSIVAYYKTKFDQNPKYEPDHIRSLYAYGNAYNLNQKYDSALVVNKNAIKLSLKSKDSILYGRILLTSAVAHYFKQEYQSSLDSISKLKQINKRKTQSDGTIIRLDLYLGKIYYGQRKFKKSIQHLSKVDSLIFTKNYFFPSMRDTYELLIKYYKEQGNSKKQIHYIDRLLTVDSILHNDYKYLSKQINEEYSTPNLILEKQHIIDSLKKENKTKIVILIILSALFPLLILVLIRNNRKKKKYQKRFLELLDSSHKIAYSANQSNEIKKNVSSDIGISDLIVEDILKNLRSFENKNDFLQPNLTVSSLSKQFKTNSKYLSKVINVHKNKSFSNYINNLRIDYVIEELKSNHKYRKYTIKAIANEIGFNTTEAFSKSFYKTKGIYPSFFLKQLESTKYGNKKKEII